MTKWPYRRPSLGIICDKTKENISIHITHNIVHGLRINDMAIELYFRFIARKIIGRNELCRKTTLPGIETLIGVNFNMFRDAPVAMTLFVNNCAPNITHGNMWLLAGPVLILYSEAHFHGRSPISVAWRACCLWPEPFRSVARDGLTKYIQRTVSQNIYKNIVNQCGII